MGSRRCAPLSTPASTAPAKRSRSGRPGEGSPWDSVDHISVLDGALAQLPEGERRQVLVRADTGACSKAFFHQITNLGLEYSVGFRAMDTVRAAVEAIPEQAWRAAVDGDGEP